MIEVGKLTGWAYQIDRYFNTLFALTIVEVVKCVDIGKITHNEYLQILQRAWIYKTHTEEEFRSWLAAGHITAEEFHELTGLE